MSDNPYRDLCIQIMDDLEVKITFNNKISEDLMHKWKKRLAEIDGPFNHSKTETDDENVL